MGIGVSFITSFIPVKYAFYPFYKSSYMRNNSSSMFLDHERIGW